MKALAILLVLAALVGFGLFALMDESDADLRRVEDEIQARLEAAEAALREATAQMVPLRARRPNVARLDRALVGIRAEVDAARQRLSQLRAQRPRAGEPRTPALDLRRQERDALAGVAARAEDLKERVLVIERFAGSTEPRLNELLTNTGLLHRSRAALAERGAEGDEDLLLKLDQLASEAEAARRLAIDVLDAAPSDVAQARILAETAEKEIDRILREQRALAARIQPR